MVRRFKIFCFLIFSAVVVFSFSPLCGQENQPQAQVKESQIIESLEFREVDIKDVLRQLAKQYNLNIVFSETVKGLVTVQLNNVSVEQALDSIITVNGFAYTKKDDVYKVTTHEEAERQGKQTKLFKLNNADALKLKETLGKSLNSGGSIEADSRSNSIIITDSPAVISKIEAMIPLLDEITPQVLIEAKMIETSLGENDKLGIDWTTTIKASGGASPITFPFSSKGNTTPGSFSPSSAPADTNFANAKGFPYAVASNFTFGTLDFTSLQAVFDFLKTRTNTKLVANPRIVTLNNQSAAINVGKVLSLPTYQMNENTGKLEITGWTPYNVGVNLSVIPQVSPDGHIKLKLKPEVSSLVGYASTRDGVQEGPITSSRSAQTEVQIKDGQTVVIGGLVKEESVTKIKKVPVLGDIPLLGFLFTRKEVGDDQNPTEKTDLLIFVTARILKDTDKPLIANDPSIITHEKRPYKLNMREVK
ncbi:MAG: secretin N-terminal domain-containing protein [Candidatus Omnitrophica bacterium]|nr:secretin N-terminal domain-containing protein [Candidatus Omnitrophota bacterium]